jgi:hypothetical protein
MRYAVVFRAWALVALSTSFAIFAAVSQGDTVAPAWECEKPYWIASPEIDDGIFQAAIGGSCSIRLSTTPSMNEVMRILRAELEKSGKFEIHSAPVSARHNDLNGFRYDLTDPVSDAKEKIKVRQNVFLGTDGVSRFLYDTESTDIKAEGHASFLQKVTFSAQMKMVTNGISVTFSNSVWVKRPWLVFNFIFRPMGEKITEEKFELARTRLLEHFLTKPLRTERQLTQDPLAPSKPY